MRSEDKRSQNKLSIIVAGLQDFAYLETFTLVVLYLGVGYLIDSKDICMIHSQISYILILLSIITLFHGFENGLFALVLLAIAIWFFYPVFDYTAFLVALMMTMIFSEFHYFWTKKIKKAELDANYRGLKLDELSKSFYALKISHDQLEKNYVVKPMSIRNSIGEIIKQKIEIDNDTKIDIDERTKEYYKSFLILLEKSFSVSKSLVVYKKAQDTKILAKDNALQVCSSTCNVKKLNDIFDNYLVDKAISRKQAVFISDENGNPDLEKINETKFVAAIPSVRDGEVVSVLAVEVMPFMAFNRENLTSIAILLEYLSLSVAKEDSLYLSSELDSVEDKDFRSEYIRLKRLYDKYGVESTVLVMKIDNELQTLKINNKVEKMLRSLEFTTTLHSDKYYYIVNLFPLHDKSSAVGYVNRLLSRLDDERDKNFEYVSFNIKDSRVLNKYLKEDYSE
jgi:polysaccharide biosynthesis protein PelD